MSYKTSKPSHLELINQKGRDPIQPPKLLEHIRKSTLSNCEQLLAHLFSATDDLFYDLSKRASSNNEQNLYFEAMREIRVKREGIANQFLRDISALFSRLVDSAFDIPSDNDEENNLSIVEGDDLEVDLARSNMISRSRDMFHIELHELGLRLDHLLLQIEVNEDNNPVDPQQLADAFLGACHANLEIDIKAKLILYKLYEKHVLKQLGHIYADTNQILLDAGILPQIPKAMSKRPVQHGGVESKENTESTQNEHSTAQAQAALPQPVEFRMGFDALTMLMATARNMAFTGNVSAPTGINNTISAGGMVQQPVAGGYYVFSSNPGPLMASPELTSQLTQSQSHFESALDTQPRQNIVASAVQHILAEKDPEKPSAVEQEDENVINLVALFFDQILSDESLPTAVQGLICRLQIPILKVALRDRSFFDNPQHPARELVNTITEASVGFDETKPIEKEPLYTKMADVVQRINRLYRADDRIFAELKAELDIAIERDRKKSTTVEARTTQAEAGKSKIKQARSASQNIIYQKLKDAHLPDSMHTFLSKHWLQVMVFSYLRQGYESHEWLGHEQTITDLVWIGTPHDDTRSVQRVERLLPELMDRVETGLNLAINDKDHCKTLVKGVEQAIEALQQAAIYDDEENQEPLNPLSEEHKEALGKGENDPKAWDEMTAVERQQAHYEELSSHYFEAAKNMPSGTWFEFFDSEATKTYRCKLASKIDSETYIFVNRLGFKVIERTRKQFACDMQFNRAKPIDADPFFDRMMGKVVTNLSPTSQ